MGAGRLLLESGQDKRRGLEVLNEAYRQGAPHAALTLGLFAARGVPGGVPPNPKIAAPRLRLALQAGLEDARVPLVAMLAADPSLRLPGDPQ